MGKKILNSDYLYSTNLSYIKDLSNQKDFDEADLSDFSSSDISTFHIEKHPSWSSYQEAKVLHGDNYDISSFEKIKEVKKVSTNNKDIEELINLKTKKLVSFYREFGHLLADLNPLNFPKNHEKKLDLKFDDISGDDFNKKTEILDLTKKLKLVYANKIGFEFSHIKNLTEREWLYGKSEDLVLKEISDNKKLRILKDLIKSDHFEQFLHKKFPGAKRFSLEGGDALIPALKELILFSSSEKNVKKIFFGMAHRGRLNVLVNILNKPYHRVISEFQGAPNFQKEVTIFGDVKYHLGYESCDEDTNTELSLAFNPSHLEAVNSVVNGQVRAWQHQSKSDESFSILIHGDAAFSGQGTVFENLMMSSINGYNVGGTIHIIINNQIGFTANYNEGRGTIYSSDLAKSIDAPIIHVNGDDIESVIKSVQIAFLYKAKFKKDVVIDLICYRRYGHNESDEPMFTQPVMYQAINKHSRLVDIYKKEVEHLVSEKQFTILSKSFYRKLDYEMELATGFKPKDANWLRGKWKDIEYEKEDFVVDTSVKSTIIKDLVEKLTEVIDKDFSLNAKINRQLKTKRKLFNSGKIDWSLAESLAFASLLNEGYDVRLSGQDSVRGTFSHRHAKFYDIKTRNAYSVFDKISTKGSKFEAYNSFLSEFGVLAFEYGYSINSPYCLTIWEAQFGDFANGAQVIFDQFISSGEEKWLRKSNLVTLLPHGYEGQGPEHSSARLERFLQSCANNNIRVVNLTTPANFFHILRRQIYSKDRKPLIVMSPKSLIRHKMVISEIEEFSSNKFMPLIGDQIVLNTEVRKVIICSGKVYYDLIEKRISKEISDIAIVRLEQFFPFPEQKLKDELSRYKNCKEIIWCQEEPKNMGGWSFVNEIFSLKNIAKLLYIGRDSSSSPATGCLKYHNETQDLLLEEAIR